MYKVTKKVHSEAKPDWMVGVLYQIPPKVYDWQESFDACMKHLIIIKDILEKSSVKWHRGSRNLTQIRNVKVKGESLLVLTKAGRSSLSFRIIEKYEIINTLFREASRESPRVSYILFFDMEF